MLSPALCTPAQPLARAALSQYVDHHDEALFASLLAAVHGCGPLCSMVPAIERKLAWPGFVPLGAPFMVSLKLPAATVHDGLAIGADAFAPEKPPAVQLDRATGAPQAWASALDVQRAQRSQRASPRRAPSVALRFPSAPDCLWWTCTSQLVRSLGQGVMHLFSAVFSLFWFGLTGVRGAART